MKEEFCQLQKEKEQVLVVEENFDNLSESQIKDEFYNLYLICFGNKSISKASAKIYRLGKFYLKLNVKKLRRKKQP